MVDLHPAGFQRSQVRDVYGDTQVGDGSTGVGSHALWWRGSADSVVDLHPQGFVSSEAYGVAGSIQAGTGLVSLLTNETHALAWNGTAESVIDLHPYLDQTGIGPWIRSSARGIAPNGDIVGEAFGGGVQYAVLWSPIIPEPHSILLLAAGAVILGAARRGR
jgi:hypothetical protein